MIATNLSQCRPAKLNCGNWGGIAPFGRVDGKKVVRRQSFRLFVKRATKQFFENPPVQTFLLESEEDLCRAIGKSNGADERTRTFTGVTPQRPQRCASTIPPHPHVLIGARCLASVGHKGKGHYCPLRAVYSVVEQQERQPCRHHHNLCARGRHDA